MTDAAIPAPQPTAQPTAPDSPPQPAASSRPPLRRSGTDRMLGGVSGGLAEHLGIDALLWRIGFVALTLAGGSGILVYLLLWVLMPPAPRGPQDQVSPLDRLAERLHAALNGSSATLRQD
jgi:phage shock protein PspC (stress-responsive transcriptional regulator)